MKLYNIQVFFPNPQPTHSVPLWVMQLLIQWSKNLHLSAPFKKKKSLASRLTIF